MWRAKSSSPHLSHWNKFPKECGVGRQVKIPSDKKHKKKKLKQNLPKGYQKITKKATNQKLQLKKIKK
jgi:hypothetical protein